MRKQSATKKRSAPEMDVAIEVDACAEAATESGNGTSPAMKRLMGLHAPIAGGLHNALLKSQELACNAV